MSPWKAYLLLARPYFYYPFYTQTILDFTLNVYINGGRGNSYPHESLTQHARRRQVQIRPCRVSIGRSNGLATRDATTNTEWPDETRLGETDNKVIEIKRTEMSKQVKRRCWFVCLSVYLLLSLCMCSEQLSFYLAGVIIFASDSGNGRARRYEAISLPRRDGRSQSGHQSVRAFCAFPRDT